MRASAHSGFKVNRPLIVTSCIHLKQATQMEPKRGIPADSPVGSALANRRKVLRLACPHVHLDRNRSENKYVLHGLEKLWKEAC